MAGLARVIRGRRKAARAFHFTTSISIIFVIKFIYYMVAIPNLSFNRRCKCLFQDSWTKPSPALILYVLYCP